jgi:hypothetical protein
VCRLFCQWGDDGKLRQVKQGKMENLNPTPSVEVAGEKMTNKQNGSFSNLLHFGKSHIQ